MRSRSTSRRWARSCSPRGRRRCNGSRAPCSGRAAPACRSCTSSTRAVGPIATTFAPGSPTLAIHPAGGAGERGAGDDQASAGLVHRHRARSVPARARDRAAARQRLHDPDVRGHHGAAGGPPRLRGDRAAGRVRGQGGEGAGRRRDRGRPGAPHAPRQPARLPGRHQAGRPIGTRRSPVGYQTLHVERPGIGRHPHPEPSRGAQRHRPGDASGAGGRARRDRGRRGRARPDPHRRAVATSARAATSRACGRSARRPPRAGPASSC